LALYPLGLITGCGGKEELIISYFGKEKETDRGCDLAVVEKIGEKEDKINGLGGPRCRLH